MTPLLFKVLSADHKSVYRGFDYTPYLPKKTVPGKWLPVGKKLGLCESGWHFTVRPELHWRRGAELYVAETKGRVVMGEGDKITAASGRLIERVDEKWEWLPLYPTIRALIFSSWRVKNPDAKLPEWANLSGANLSGANLSRVNLSRADLSGVNLSGADLSRVNLSRVNLSRADLSGVDLSGADLSGADLSRANLYWANLYWADLSGANLSRANLYGAYNVPPLPTGWKIGENGIVVKA